MPSGYTAGVGNGSVTDFREYAMACARQFGALIEMRDDPPGATIPDKFEPSTYHTEQLESITADLAAIASSTNAEIKALADGWYSGECIRHEDILKEKRSTKRRYDAMLTKAKAFTSPSPEHDNYASFLVSQLTDSIKRDCGESYCAAPVAKSAAEWKADMIADLTRQIEYHKKQHAEEVTRAEERTQWVSQLRAALA